MSKKILISTLAMLGIMYFNGYDFGQTKRFLLGWASADAWAPENAGSDWGSPP